MARLRTAKDIQKLYDKDRLQKKNIVNYATQVSFRTQGGRSGGYIHTLNRQQRRTGSQLKGIPGCGSTVRDWLTGY
jgi:hypothetical protein